MANVISGQIIAIGQTQKIAPKSGQGNTLVKREFVIRAMRFNPEDGTPELSEFNTPNLEINGEDKVGVLDNFKVGDCVKCNISIEGRSYEDANHNVRYFNSVRATRIEKLNIQLAAPAPAQSAQQPAPQPAAAPAPAAAPTAQPQGQGGGVDEHGNPLPF